KNIFEDIGKPAAASKTVAEAATHAAIFKGRVTKPVIGGPLLRVLQRFVSLADFLELAFSFRIIRIAIRMIFHGEFTKGCLQRLVVCCSFNTQSFVVIDLHQFVIPATGTRLLLSRTSYPETGPQIRATRPKSVQHLSGASVSNCLFIEAPSNPICQSGTPVSSINTTLSETVS